MNGYVLANCNWRDIVLDRDVVAEQVAVLPPTSVTVRITVLLEPTFAQLKLLLLRAMPVMPQLSVEPLLTAAAFVEP